MRDFFFIIGFINYNLAVYVTLLERDRSRYSSSSRNNRAHYRSREMVRSDLIPPADFQPCWGTRCFSEQRGTEVSKRLVISTVREIWYGPWRGPNLTVDRTGWVTIGPYGAMEPRRVNRRL